MESKEYIRLMNIEKTLNSNILELPPFGLQKYYKLHGKIISNEKFNSIISRTGHINKGKFTILLLSKSHGLMIRFDVLGSNHDEFPTPHLHIYNQNNGLDNSTFISTKELPLILKESLRDLDNRMEIFLTFLKFINVDTSDIKLVGNNV
ncbi:DUF6978 family protein [Companilactobacillus ginsenosidimutans]|uniref:Uncharacterized protein n=1 Tax=Companilactobacillus ginsenosidimutans TaxID=1007676 RepID=A0A0H4QM21_9LACO|nr:hypothetical protein [Companilactobacillus ginsenosidimutans]AKP67758.1 hypothetical protein ABM34_09600 [Companilactobacillus ginsenosidimutans]